MSRWKSHTCNPSIHEVEAGESLLVWGWSKLCSAAVSHWDQNQQLTASQAAGSLGSAGGCEPPVSLGGCVRPGREMTASWFARCRTGLRARTLQRQCGYSLPSLRAFFGLIPTPQAWEKHFWPPCLDCSGLWQLSEARGPEVSCCRDWGASQGWGVLWPQGSCCHPAS